MRVAPKLEPIRTEPPASPPSPARPAPLPAVDGEPSPFARMLHGLGREMNRGEAITRAALSAPADLGPAELLALQAGVYRYSEAVDLASKLVDRATSGVKTIIQGSGQ